MNNYFVWVEITANTQTILDGDRFRAAMEKCAGIGIDSVILSIKDTSGFVLYNSSLAPHYSKFKDNFEEVDYLERCIRIVHECGMKIYASFDVFAEGNKMHRSPLMKGCKRRLDV